MIIFFVLFSSLHELKMDSFSIDANGSSGCSHGNNFVLFLFCKSIIITIFYLTDDDFTLNENEEIDQNEDEEIDQG